MSTDQLILKNDILVDRESKKLTRLLYVGDPDKDGEHDLAWLIHTQAEFPSPFRAKYSSLVTDYQKFKRAPDEAKPFTVDGSTTQLRAFRRTASAASIKLADRAYRSIEELVGNPDIFHPHLRNALLVAHAEKLKGTELEACPKTLLKYFRDFWTGGQTENALLGHFENCRRPSAVGTAGRGMKRKVNGVERPPYQLSEDDLRKMKAVIEDYYFTPERTRRLTDVLQYLHETQYTRADGNGVQCLLPSHECPSYRQLEYFLNSRYPREERIRRKKGDKEFEQNHRDTAGSVQLDCHGVGHMYEFDATIVDTILCLTGNRAELVGKPTMYLIIDRASRLIVGWYIGFENASYAAAAEAILSLAQDKEKLCEYLGIPYNKDDWPADGIAPEVFLADQGELVSRVARRIARSLHCNIVNVPGLRPEWKPLVECGFSMLHQIIAAETPGYAPDKASKERQGLKPEKHAALFLKEFTSIMVKAIITYNRTMQTDFPLTPQQVADGVKPYPIALWNHGIQRRMGKLDRIDYDTLREELMPRDTGVITKDGISYQGLHYNCPEATARGWLVEARRKRKPLDIAFDYRNVDEIIVYSPDGSGESFTATLSKDSVNFIGYSFAEVKRHFWLVQQLIGDAKDDKRDARFEYHKHAGPIQERATKEMKAALKGKSRAARKKDIKMARTLELQEERDRLSGVSRAGRTYETPVGIIAEPSALPMGGDEQSSNDPVAPTPTPPSAPAPDAAPAVPRPLSLKERLAAARMAIAV